LILEVSKKSWFCNPSHKKNDMMYRNILKFLLSIIGILAVQITITSHLRIFDLSPDLLLVFLILISLNKPRHVSPVIGFAGGLIQDVMTGGTVGVFALSKSIACYVSGLFPTSKHESSQPLLGFIFFLMAVLENIISFAFLSRESAAGHAKLFLRYGLPSAVYTALAGIGIIVFLAWFNNRRLRG